MKETWGERDIDTFLQSLKAEYRLIIKIFYDYKLLAWFAIVQEFRRKQPIQQKLF